MVEPKRAAACILRNPHGEVLLGKRNYSMRFMGGHHVFPGGRVDSTDNVEWVAGIEDLELGESIFAAAREVYEETGILCSRTGNFDPDLLRKLRLELLDNSLDFPTILKELNAQIDGSHFEAAGHWITPSASPIRFDTKYFLYHFDGSQSFDLIQGEFIELDWMLPQEARDRWHKHEIELSPPVAYTLHHLAAVEHPDALHLLDRDTQRSPGTPKRQEIRRGIHYIPLNTKTIPPASQTNCIVIGDERLLIIDPGSDDPEELNLLKSQLDHLIELGSTLEAIVLTHSHHDHTDGIPFLQETYGLPIWAHEKTDEQIDYHVDRHIEDNEMIELPGNPAWRIKALHTPGHDPGHLSFYEESTRILFCGDMIANPGTIVVSQSYGGNMQQFIDSLDRLIAIEDASLVVPAHGMFSENPQEEIAKHKTHRLWRENKIYEAWDSGAHTISDLLTTAYDDAPKEALRLAEHALKAHLERLGLTPE
jgi:glyoxylase-like metal-dependent hydrolase (beta-lactamase superfamily II)/8-oxo-dGTP pyrophosphatase MutT (NUDIX family)